MHPKLAEAFLDELVKTSMTPGLQNGLEVGGLGMLGIHPAKRLITGQSKREGTRAQDAAEVGGLGVLGIHPAMQLGGTLLKKVRP